LRLQRGRISALVYHPNLNFIAFSRYLGDIQGQIFALFAIAIAAAEVAVGLAIIIIAYRLYKDIDVAAYKFLRG